MESGQLGEKILIAGGSGVIGISLSQFLKQKGYQVSILSRSESQSSPFKTYLWNPEKDEIDKDAFENLKYVIQLSGANISEKRWTNERKKEIIESRIRTTNLLFLTIKNSKIKLKAFISASAIGYYGAVSSNHIYTESDPAGGDFLAKTCIEWEKTADQFNNIGIRTIKIRTGIVLTKTGGALSKMTMPIKFGFGSALGSGEQYFPWIHISDLCQIYLKAMRDDNMNGAYNAVAPSFIMNKDFTKSLAKALDKPLWLPNIPSFILKMIFGEMSIVLLHGSRISSEKLLAAGYHFQFKEIENTLIDLFPLKS
ncbi:MAG: TIGR01777 family oxidoreductase [Saprospiraceae bacterium]